MNVEICEQYMGAGPSLPPCGSGDQNEAIRHKPTHQPEIILRHNFLECLVVFLRFSIGVKSLPNEKLIFN